MSISVAGSVPEMRKINTILTIFSNKSSTYSNLVSTGPNITVKFVAISQGGSGGHAQGNQVIIDLLSPSNGNRMTPKEAAESMIFEVQNACNNSTYKKLKKKLFEGKTTLIKYGEDMAKAEFKSTEMVANILNEVVNTFGYTKKILENVSPPSNYKDYWPSSWGVKQCMNATKGSDAAANSPHAEGSSSSIMRLPSKEMYSFQVVQHAKLIDKLIKNMVTLTYYKNYKWMPFDANLIVKNVKNASNEAIYLAFLDVLSILERTSGSDNKNWKVAWKEDKKDWEFTTGMKKAVNSSGGTKALLREPLSYVEKNYIKIRLN